MRPTTVTGQEQEPRPGRATQVAARTATTPEPQRMQFLSHTGAGPVTICCAHSAECSHGWDPVAAAPRCPWPHLSPPYGLTMDCPLRLDTRLGRPLPPSLALSLPAEALMLTHHEPGPASPPGYSHLCPWVATATGGPRCLRDSSVKHNGPRNRHAAPGIMPRLSLNALGGTEKGRRVLTVSS